MEKREYGPSTDKENARHEKIERVDHLQNKETLTDEEQEELSSLLAELHLES